MGLYSELLNQMWEHFFHVEGVAAALAIIAMAIAVVEWFLSARDESRANRRFVKDVGTNHLPHVYDRLGRIDNKLGMSYVQPPPVQFEEPPDSK